MDADPENDSYRLQSRMFLFKVCGQAYRYQERPQDGAPIRAPQLSDIYIQKWAIGGHPPEELEVVIQWSVASGQKSSQEEAEDEEAEC